MTRLFHLRSIFIRLKHFFYYLLYLLFVYIDATLTVATFHRCARLYRVDWGSHLFFGFFLRRQDQNWHLLLLGRRSCEKVYVVIVYYCCRFFHSTFCIASFKLFTSMKLYCLSWNNIWFSNRYSCVCIFRSIPSRVNTVWRYLLSVRKLPIRPFLGTLQRWNHRVTLVC